MPWPGGSGRSPGVQRAAVLVWLDVDPEEAAAPRRGAGPAARPREGGSRRRAAGGDGTASRVVDRAGVDLVLDGSRGRRPPLRAVVAVL